MSAMLRFAAVMLVIVGYSVGAVLCAKREKRRTHPGLFDNVVIVVLAMTVLAVPLPSRFLYLLVAVMCGAFSGFVVNRRGRRDAANSFNEFECYPIDINARQSIWKKWRSFASECADFQVRMWITFLYLLCLWPFALFMRNSAGRISGSRWSQRTETPATLGEA